MSPTPSLSRNAITTTTTTTRNVFLLAIILLTTVADSQKHNALRPPTIIEHPDKEMTFRLREEVTLPCRASGNPKPTYTWKKDDKPIDLEDNLELHLKPGEGSLVINMPINKDEGYYQCFATNTHGVASSVRTLLKEAVQQGFPTVKEPRKFTPTVGDPLILTCTPPHSYPTPVVYWGLIKFGEKLTPLDNTDRINADYNGNFYFANVEMEDHRHGATYICISQNSILRSLVQGEDCIITPKSKRDHEITPKAPKLMWSSPTNDLALAGQTKRMKCIFSGYPTPNVTWTRLDRELPARIEYPQKGMLPHELVISHVDVSDQGVYECKGKNVRGEEKVVVRLTVESTPYWKDGRGPEEVNTSEDENATITCHAEGIPKPDVQFFINGESLKNLPDSPKRIFDAEKSQLTFLSVSSLDTRVVQCNASNKHGYILESANINVFAEQPSFQLNPDPVTRVAEGKVAVIKCKSYGAPKPVITWYKDGRKVEGEKFKIDPTGNLLIYDTSSEDSGSYTCDARNKFGNDSTTGRLLVRKPTEVSKPQEPLLTANVSNPVVLHCNVTTDEEEKKNLKVTWYRDDVMIEFGDGEPGIFDSRDRSLTFNQVQMSDQGLYKCVAKNDIDNDSVEYDLVVKGPPNPPEDVTVECLKNYTAIIRWFPGSDNNEPLLGFSIYCNTSWDLPGVYHEHKQDHSLIPANKDSAKFKLQPWNNYTFHMTATNRIGVSPKSVFTPLGDCNTDASVPLKNPDNVCTESRNENELYIKWDSMKREEQAGPNFHYKVSYKRLRGQGIDDDDDDDDVSDDEVVQQIFDLNANNLSVPNVGVYRAFEIYVLAVNEKGSAHNVKKVIGYSGQGKPKVVPRNLKLLEHTLTWKNATFEWDPVVDDVSLIQGYLTGYKIHYWRTEHPNDVRTVYVSVRPWIPCKQVHKRKRHNRNIRGDGRNGKKVNGTVTNLWPDATINAAVMVVNGGGAGDLSDPISFKTPEGVPSPVEDLKVVERGSDHLKIRWSPPKESNGNLTGFEIHYKQAPPSMESKKEVLINDTNKLEKKLMDLEPGKPYLITVYGTTKAGRGSENFIEDRTRPEAAPTPPIMGPIEIGDDYINVSWTPTDDPDDPNQNPGSTFAVEYKPTDPDKADDDAASSDQGPGLGGGKPSEDDDDDTYDDDDDGDEDDDSDGGNDDDHEKSPDDQKPTGVLPGFDKIKTTKKPSGSIDDLDSEDYRDSDDEDKPVGPKIRPHDRPKDKDAPERSKDDYSGPGGQQPSKDSRPTKDGRPDDKQPGSDSDDDKSDDNDDEDDSRHTHDEGGDDGFGGPVGQKPDGSKKPSTEKPDDGTARSDGDGIPVGSSGPDGTGRPDDSGKPNGSSGKDGSDGRPGGGDSDPKRPSDKPGGDDEKIGDPEDSDGKQAGAGKIGDTEEPDGDGGDGKPKKQPGDKPRKPGEDDNIKRPVDRFPSDDHDDPRREHPRTDDDDFVEKDKLGPHVVGPGPGSQDGQDRPRSDNYRPDDEGVGRPGVAGRPGGGDDKGVLHPKTTPKVPKKKGQKKGKKNGTWKRTIPESENNWINVTDLKPGATYDVRIVAKNKGGKEAKTNATKIVVIPETKRGMQSKSAGLNWLLLLLLILLLLLLLICIILLCCIRCNRGGVYPVYEKEKLRGHDYLKEEDDAGFGEYTRADEPAMLKGTKGSLDSVEKPLEESETDSLGEYEDPDPSKFNEDGSFIGQYGGKKKGGGGDEVATPTNALSSFV